jgi:hypothetical protein
VAWLRLPATRCCSGSRTTGPSWRRSPNRAPPASLGHAARVPARDTVIGETRASLGDQE